jgi:hypothetical protein
MIPGKEPDVRYQSRKNAISVRADQDVARTDKMPFRHEMWLFCTVLQ